MKRHLRDIKQLLPCIQQDFSTVSNLFLLHGNILRYKTILRNSFVFFKMQFIYIFTRSKYINFMEGGEIKWKIYRLGHN